MYCTRRWNPQPSKRVQECKQVIDLLVIKHAVKWRHIASPADDRVAHVFVSSGHAARQSPLRKHSHQRWTLQGLLLVSVVAYGTVGREDLATAKLLSG